MTARAVGGREERWEWKVESAVMSVTVDIGVVVEGVGYNVFVRTSLLFESCTF